MRTHRTVRWIGGIKPPLESDVWLIEFARSTLVGVHLAWWYISGFSHALHTSIAHVASHYYAFLSPTNASTTSEEECWRPLWPSHSLSLFLFIESESSEIERMSPKVDQRGEPLYLSMGCYISTFSPRFSVVRCRSEGGRLKETISIFAFMLAFLPLFCVWMSLSLSLLFPPTFFVLRFNWIPQKMGWKSEGVFNQRKWIAFHFDSIAVLTFNYRGWLYYARKHQTRILHCT